MWLPSFVRSFLATRELKRDAELPALLAEADREPDQNAVLYDDIRFAPSEYWSAWQPPD